MLRSQRARPCAHPGEIPEPVVDGGAVGGASPGVQEKIAPPDGPTLRGSVTAFHVRDQLLSAREADYEMTGLERDFESPAKLTPGAYESRVQIASSQPPADEQAVGIPRRGHTVGAGCGDALVIPHVGEPT